MTADDAVYLADKASSVVAGLKGVHWWREMMGAFHTGNSPLAGAKFLREHADTPAEALFLQFRTEQRAYEAWMDFPPRVRVAAMIFVGTLRTIDKLVDDGGGL